jgi:hypothetical protein
LLKPHEAKRQEAVAKAIDACIRDGRIDLFIEWHHYWRPENKDDLWPVGPRAAKAGLELYAKRLPPKQPNELEDRIALHATFGEHRFHDSGDFDLSLARGGVWHVRADRVFAGLSGITFASVLGPVQHVFLSGGRYLALGPVEAASVRSSFVACDGDIGNGTTTLGTPLSTQMVHCVVVCRGTVRLDSALEAVILVDGDIDFHHSAEAKNSLIRASGEIRLPKFGKPENCTIEANAKDATAPYKFIEFADVGLRLADDEEGLIVRDVKPNTPFGNCGIQKGDLVRAIDDAPAGHSEEFRKRLRRAVVRQGDCLVTVIRGEKTIDLPVFFPLPK